MANINTVFGARYLMDPFGGSASGKLLPFAVLAGDATALYVGDFVKLTGTADFSENLKLGYLPVVTQATATHVVLGVVEGFGEDPSNLEKIYRPANTARTVWVNVNYNAFFTIQSDGTCIAADIGQCADIVVGAGNTFTGLSGMQLNHASLSGSDGQLKIVGLAPGSEFGLYTKLVVMMNEQFYKQVAGV